MSEHDDLDAVTEAAWVGFRRRLADHLAALVDGQEIVLRCPTPAADEQATPEVVVNAVGTHLHVRDGHSAHPARHEQRYADRVAADVVGTLRSHWAVVHPSFLAAGGLEQDPTTHDEGRAPDIDGSEPFDDELQVGFPQDREHLQAMVDGALRPSFGPLRHDDDGDVVIVAGSSVAFVRTLSNRPAVELYAEIVIAPDAADAGDDLEHELRLLNDLHPLWKFSFDGERVLMVHEVPAEPFVAMSVRRVVRRFVSEVDQIAAGLVVRVGGRLFREPAPLADERDTVMAGLLELLHLERVPTSTVAALLGHDRLEIIRQLVRIRRGEQTCGSHDPEMVLDVLRRALRRVVDGEPPVRSVPRARPRSVQEPLLEGLTGDDALDLGWSA